MGIAKMHAAIPYSFLLPAVGCGSRGAGHHKSTLVATTSKDLGLQEEHARKKQNLITSSVVHIGAVNRTAVIIGRAPRFARAQRFEDGCLLSVSKVCQTLCGMMTAAVELALGHGSSENPRWLEAAFYP